MKRAIDEATEALHEAVELLTSERRTRRLQMLTVACAIAIIGVLMALTYQNSRSLREQSEDIQEQAKRQIIAECSSRNDTRRAIRGVLLALAEQEGRSPEAQAKVDGLLASLDGGVLEIVECPT